MAKDKTKSRQSASILDQRLRAGSSLIQGTGRGVCIIAGYRANYAIVLPIVCVTPNVSSQQLTDEPAAWKPRIHTYHRPTRTRFLLLPYPLAPHRIAIRRSFTRPYYTLGCCNGVGASLDGHVLPPSLVTWEPSSGSPSTLVRRLLSSSHVRRLCFTQV